MRIFFSSVGGHGHTYPLLPLAIAAREAGHEVFYGTAERFHPLLARLGFRPLAVGTEIGAAFGELFAADGPQTPGDFTQEETTAFAMRVFGEIIPRRAVADLGPLIAEHRPDLLVHESGDPGAGLAARIAGVPGICHGFGRVGDAMSSVFTGAGFRELAAEHGVELPSEVPIGLGDPYLDICPPSIQGRSFLATANRLPLRPVAFAEPGELPAWVREPGPPLIYLTMGTAFGETSVMRTAIAALGRLDARVLVASGPTLDAAEFADLPANVTLQAWVPQADLLPFAALVVHHGGSGTTLGCLAAGVPQLVLPQGADQFFNAEAVADAGAGAQLLPDAVDTDEIADAAGRLLADEAVRAAAGDLAAEVAAMPSPADVVRELPVLVRAAGAA